MIMTNKEYLHEDITDSPQDRGKLNGDLAILDLPEIKDIPGASRSKKTGTWTADNETFSSADEEGDELLEEQKNPVDTDISPLEKELLNDAFDPSYDIDLPIQSLALDDRDNEGDLLEEAGQNKDLFGKDLDDNLIREEDEETTGERQQ
jgi:hypothetical protein